MGEAGSFRFVKVRGLRAVAVEVGRQRKPQRASREKAKVVRRLYGNKSSSLRKKI